MNILAYAEFKKTKLGVTGLTVTVDVDQYTRSDGTRTAIVTAGSAVEGRNGEYHYLLTNVDLKLYDYVFCFKSADTTLDDQQPKAVWTLFPVGYDTELLRLDAAVTTRAAPGDAMILTAAYEDAKTAAQAADIPAMITAAEIGAAVLDAVAADHDATGSVGKAIISAGNAGDPWSASKTAYPTGTFGDAINKIQQHTDLIEAGTALPVTAGLVAGVMTVTAFATYDETLSGLTIPANWAVLYMTAKEHVRDADADALFQLRVSNPAAGSDGLITLDGATATAAQGGLVPSVGLDAVRIWLADNATAILQPTSFNYDVKVICSDGTSNVLATGTGTVTHTPTRTI